MSTAGRGRGYTGRHHLREETSRPGDAGADTKPETPRPGDVECKKDTARMTEPITAPELQKDKRSVPVKQDAKEDPVVKTSSLHGDDEALKELLFIDEPFVAVLAQLDQFNPGEDGIVFNRKLRQFETSLTALCPDEPRLHKAFSAFGAGALVNSQTARKLATVGASFTRQQRQNVLRAALLNVMQGTFAKLDVIERAPPQILINAANLMGDYFAEARLCNGNKVQILCGPLLQYMRSLLASSDVRAHRSLATQLMQNGRELLTTSAQELDELSISIRIRLLTPPPASIIWLLLSADLCINKFLPLPNTLQQFYASHLDLTQDSETPNPNYSEVSYGSWKTSPEKDGDRNIPDLPESSPESSIEKASQNVSQLNLSQDDNSEPRKLRPILGAGAGLSRQNNSFTSDMSLSNQSLNANQDSYDTWTNKTLLAKRYDLNSWRQGEGEEGQEIIENSPITQNSDQVFLANPPFVPPNVQFPPPTFVPQNDVKYTPSQYPSDGTYAQPPPFVGPNDGPFTQSYVPKQPYIPSETRYPTSNPPIPQGDSVFTTPLYKPTNQTSNTSVAERLQNQHYVDDKSMQNFQNSERHRRPPENWRKDKGEPNEDPNRNTRQKNWTRQKSKDSFSDDASTNVDNCEADLNFANETRVGFRDGAGDAKAFRTSGGIRGAGRESRPSNRLSRTNLNKKDLDPPEPQNGKPVPLPNRRHVSDVPRSNKYWDHDDRCDKDYNS